MGCVDACVHGLMAQVVSSVASQQESFWLDSPVLVGWGPFPCMWMPSSYFCLLQKSKDMHVTVNDFKLDVGLSTKCSSCNKVQYEFVFVFLN